MSEPTGSLYPTTYDTDASLLGAPGNREVFTVASQVDVNGLVFITAEDLSAVNLPCYIVFEGGEICWVEAIGGANDRFVLASSAQRALGGSKLQPHGVGELIYITIDAQKHNLFREGVRLAQKYQGLTGLDADKSATPDPGWRYTASDTGKVYYCFVVNTWTWVNVVDHGDTTGRGDDDHTQYHTDARALTWHDGEPGVHVDGGDDHDHIQAGQGLAVVRIVSGLYADIPAAQDGSVYFATDLDGGTLLLGQSTDWVKISGVPTGGIMGFDGACPAGWTRETNLDSKYPMGDDTAGVTGGAATHVHVQSTQRAHYHTVPADTAASSNDGGHTHGMAMGSGSGGLASSSGGASDGTGSAGSHTHSGTKASHSTASAGVSSPSTDAASSLPASREVVWCIKS